MTRTAWVRTGLLSVATIAAVTAIGACSSNSGSGAADSAASVINGEAKGMAPNVGAPAPARGDVSGGDALDTGYAASGKNTSSTGGGNTGTTTLALESHKIRIAEITVSVHKPEDVAAAADNADDIAAKYNGEVFGDDRRAGKNASAQIVIKVPPQSLHAALDDLAKLGKEKARSESTKDVTAQVIDVDTRVANLKASIATLQLLFDRPNQKLSDIIRLESELSQRQSELESMQAQQRALHAQTDTATITLNLSTEVAAAKHHKKTGGFVGGLRDGWDAFVKGATAVARALGAVIPFAVLLVIVVLGLKLAWPRIGISRRPRPTPEPAAE